MRVLTRDDERQAKLAHEAIAADFQITATVLLELEWLLRSAYAWTREQRALGLLSILDLPHAMACPLHARWAVERMARGADFADMMHLATAEGAGAFATFDRRVRKGAGADAPLPVETLL